MTDQSTSGASGNPPAERQRAVNFSEREVDILVEQVLGQYDALFTRSRLDNEGRRRIWRDLLTAINAEGVAVRTIEQVRKRWEDYKSRTLRKARRFVERGERRAQLSIQQSRVLERMNPALHRQVLAEQTRLESSAQSDEEGGEGAVEQSGGDATTSRRRRARSPPLVVTSSGDEGTGAASATTAAAEGAGEPPQGPTMAEDGTEPSRRPVRMEEKSNSQN